jgi:hypothetical protein
MKFTIITDNIRVRSTALLRRTVGDAAWTAHVILPAVVALLLTVLILRAIPDVETCAAGPQTWAERMVAAEYLDRCR